MAGLVGGVGGAGGVEPGADDGSLLATDQRVS